MKHIKKSTVTIALAATGLALAAVAPACTESTTGSGVGDPGTSPREGLFEPLGCEETVAELGLSPDELSQAVAQGEIVVVCGGVFDPSGNFVEGAQIRIVYEDDDESVQEGPAVDWWRPGQGPAQESSADILIEITAPGFAPLLERRAGGIIGAEFVLLPLNQQTFAPDGEIEFVDPDGVVVRLAGGSLETLAGGSPEGAVTIGTRFINPAVQTLPGDFTAETLGGETVWLQSFGTVFVSATDELGNELRLAGGQQVEVEVPIDPRQFGTGLPPNEIDLWTMDRQRGVWQQNEGQGQLNGGNPGRECELPPAQPCEPVHCDSGLSFTGSFDELGFVNFDIAWADAACVFVDIDESALGPSDLPVCFKVTVRINSAKNTRYVCAGAEGTVLFNLPDSTDIDIERAAAYGCDLDPTDFSATINSGAPWGGTGRPPGGGVCNAVLHYP